MFPEFGILIQNNLHAKKTFWDSKFFITHITFALEQLLPYTQKTNFLLLFLDIVYFDSLTLNSWPRVL